MLVASVPRGGVVRSEEWESERCEFEKDKSNGLGSSSNFDLTAECGFTGGRCGFSDAGRSLLFGDLAEYFES